jgi:hypothetical protein
MANNSTAPASPATASLTTLPATQPAVASPSGNRASASQAEGSMIGRFVAILTPFFAILAGGIAGWVAKKFPGVHLDTGQIVAFMVAAATAALTAAFKFMAGWQQHEQNVADGKSLPIRQPAATKPPRT